MLKTSSIFVLALFLPACATKPKHNQTIAIVETIPKYAVVTSGNLRANAPARWTYTLQPEEHTSQSQEVTITWQSGASVRTNLNLVAGQELTYTIRRPPGAGYEIDANYAAQVDQQNAEVAGQIAGAIGELAGQIIGAKAGK